MAEAHEENAISSVFNTLPFIFRAPILLNFVFLLWGLNVYVLDLVAIDFSPLLRPSDDVSQVMSPRSWTANLRRRKHKRITSSKIFKYSGLNFIVIGIFYGFYRVSVINGNESEQSLIFPFLMYLFFALMFINPWKCCLHKHRRTLKHTLYRIIFPADTGVAFAEVLLGDILTSVSKVLGDIFISSFLFSVVLSQYMSTSDATTIEKPITAALFDDDQNTKEDPGLFSQENSFFSINLRYQSLIEEAEMYSMIVWIRPFLIALPFMLRFRQCIFQYSVDTEAQKRTAYLNLINALKYLSALPVIFISVILQIYANEATIFGFSNSSLQQLWILTVSFNSFFAFMWDIIMDWGLCQYNSSHFLLRQELLFLVHPITSNVLGVNLKSLASFRTTSSPRKLRSNPSEVSFNQSQENLGYFPEDNSAFDQDDDERSNFLAATHLREPKDYCDIMEGYIRPSVYYGAIVFDFIFRILWSFKLSVHFQLSSEGKTFAFEICEIVRRFVWIFFRIEWESIKVSKMQEAENDVAEGLDFPTSTTGSVNGVNPAENGHLEKEKIRLLHRNAAEALRSRSTDFSRQKLSI